MWRCSLVRGPGRTDSDRGASSFSPSGVLTPTCISVFLTILQIDTANRQQFPGNAFATETEGNSPTAVAKSKHSR